MRRRGVLASLLMAPVGIVTCGTLAASGRGPDVELTIATDGDLLAFKPDELSCPAGAHVRLTFFHTGKYIRQEHDWVLMVPGAATAVAKAGVQAGESAGYVPLHDRRVLAATRLCGKGEHVSVEFVAPSPGAYPFMCSYPGHEVFMHGTLNVTPR
jgi:azurin